VEVKPNATVDNHPFDPKNYKASRRAAV